MSTPRSFLSGVDKMDTFHNRYILRGSEILRYVLYTHIHEHDGERRDRVSRDQW